ncbi:hypothetical protein H4Q32_022499 [Labeo rohita]|uniref:Uncharacterized protein n=1 Tax=Labeo rohita TaxID=84645 RepID=A0ABQ8MAM3_LABRO|nr:hypothetical protein H4Q32_022499 [Labeo rohita]
MEELESEELCMGLQCLESVWPQTGTQLDLEPSPSSPRCAEQKPEPTPAKINKPSPKRATEPRIVPEPEPNPSDQVQEPATEHTLVEEARECEGLKESPAHCTITEGERCICRHARSYPTIIRTRLFPCPVHSGYWEAIGGLLGRCRLAPGVVSPSAPPWVTFMAATWVAPGSSCSKTFMSPSCLLPGSSLQLIRLGSICLCLGSFLLLDRSGFSGLFPDCSLHLFHPGSSLRHHHHGLQPPTAINKPSPRRVTEPRIVPEPKPDPSDQVQEPTEHAPVEEARECEGLKESPAYCTTAEGCFLVRCAPAVKSCDLVCVASTHHFKPPLIILNSRPASLSHQSSPSLPTVSWHLLCSPSAHHLCSAFPCLPLRPPPRSINPAAPPWLLSPSSPPWPFSSLALLGSPVPPALPWSNVDLPPPQDFTPPAAPCPSVSVRLLLPSGFTLEPFALPWPSGTSVSSWLVGSLAVSPSSTMVPPSVGSTVGHLHGCDLAPTWPLLFQGPHVFSLAPPPLSLIRLGSFCLRLGSSLLLDRHGSSGLLPGCSLHLFHPGSSLRHHLPRLCWSSSSQSSGHLQNLLLPACANLSPSLHHLLIPPSLWHEIAPSRRDKLSHHWDF